MSLNMQKIGSAPHHELMIADKDDIIIVIPEPGFKDTPEVSRVTVSALVEYADEIGKRCGLVIVANNILAQEPESRRIYADTVTPDKFFGICMVVTSPLARMIGNLAMHLSTLKVPISLAESIESGIAWLETQRKS